MMSSIEKALVGKRYFQCSNSRVSGYFKCLHLIRPLLVNFDTSPSLRGFYINIASNNLNVVRLTYFTANPIETTREIEEFLRVNPHISSLPLENFDDEKFKKPTGVGIIDGSDEKRDRNFTNAYTHIGLDLLADYGELCTRQLIATYRLNSFPLPSPQSFFEPIFTKHSDFFRQLDDEYPIQQLWEDLSNYQRLHLFVNMLLPGDISLYGQPVSESERMNFLKIVELDLPGGWQKDCH